jgi:hypothetical protein
MIFLTSVFKSTAQKEILKRDFTALSQIGRASYFGVGI